MIEMIKEILFSMKQNKLRTLLTGFSVAWGIFMLIILLGSGQGLQNGINKEMSGNMSRDKNYVKVYRGYTAKPYKGYSSRRAINFRYEDIDDLRKSHPNIKSIATELSNSVVFKTDDKSVSGTFLGRTVEGKPVKIVEGRYLNPSDISAYRKVAVVPEYLAENLFGNSKDAIGKVFTVSSIRYLVVGVYESDSSWPTVYSPITTQISIYPQPVTKSLSRLEIETKGIYTPQQSEEFMDDMRVILGKKYSFDNTDRSAVYMYDEISTVAETQLVFTSINTFIWIIGLGTLLAGVVGVSNIMQVTVRERTNEFGIRKSMGASPRSLIKLVLVESIVLTIVFGYIGLVGGAAVMEFVSYLIDSGTLGQSVAVMSGGNGSQETPSIFIDPTINIGMAMWATLVLVVAGVVAGFIPARRAARLKTIDAMRYNK